jgi:methylation protein EvaC
MPLANGFLLDKQVAQEYFFELAPAFCETCHTFQIVEQPDPERMFHEHYAFFSGTSRMMTAHFKDMAHTLKRDFLKEKSDPFVIELGSNDGIMLQHFAQEKIRHLGIEPSENVALSARAKGVNTLCAFFGADVARDIRRDYGEADIISAANVMCHIPDLKSVAQGVQHLLKPEGVFVFEDPYLGAMLEKTSYDQIYDEHVYIFSLSAVQNIFTPFGLEVFHVDPQETHGGSMRYYLCRKGAFPKTTSVNQCVASEIAQGLNKVETYEKFKRDCEQNKRDLTSLLQRLKTEGKKVIGYAATSKSTTVLNYCGIGPNLISHIVDTTPLKYHTLSPGQHIPVVPYETFQQAFPDYAVLFAWNHAREIFAKEQDFLAQGGKWIVFTPKVAIIDAHTQNPFCIAS